MAIYARHGQSVHLASARLLLPGLAPWNSPPARAGSLHLEGGGHRKFDHCEDLDSDASLSRCNHEALSARALVRTDQRDFECIYQQEVRSTPKSVGHVGESLPLLRKGRPGVAGRVAPVLALFRAALQARARTNAQEQAQASPSAAPPQAHGP